MKILFIGGSKTIKALPHGAMEFLDTKLSEGDVLFIVGDSFGVDRAAQIFLASKGADIKVYASEGSVRNNPCNLPVVAVPAEGFRGRDFYRQKDIAMACAATEGLMIWDGKSKGTYLDIHHLLSLGKPVTLFLRGREEAIQLQTLWHYKKFNILYTTKHTDQDLTAELRAVNEGERYSSADENAFTQIRKSAYRKAHELYGEKLPQPIEMRLKKELSMIQKNNSAVSFWVAMRICNHMKKLNYPTSVTGLIGSALIAFLLEISDVNPLPAHYLCSHCHFTDFVFSVFDGFDLPNQSCPVCGSVLRGEGHNIPCETLMGCDGSKKIDIELRFPASGLTEAQTYMRALFGAVNTVDHALLQMNVLEFTVLDLLATLQNVTGVQCTTPWNDPKVLELFTQADTADIPGFGDNIERDLIREVKPKSIDDLIQSKGILCGDWETDKKDELLKTEHSLNELPLFRDQIFLCLQQYGIKQTTAFEISEAVRKGQLCRDHELFAIYTRVMEHANVPDWYIRMLRKTKYLFPKAHSVENVMTAIRIAWYKIHYPVEFPAAYRSYFGAHSHKDFKDKQSQ